LEGILPSGSKEALYNTSSSQNHLEQNNPLRLLQVNAKISGKLTKKFPINLQKNINNVHRKCNFVQKKNFRWLNPTS
jgi:hypothetical protein